MCGEGVYVGMCVLWGGECSPFLPLDVQSELYPRVECLGDVHGTWMCVCICACVMVVHV